MEGVNDDYFNIFLDKMNIDVENISTQSVLLKEHYGETASIVVYGYISPLVVTCSIAASLLTLVLFALLTHKAFEFNAYILAATFIRVMSFAFQPNTTLWLSNLLGWQYPESIENESDVFCVARHYMESFSRQVPRYLLAWLAVIYCMCSVSDRLRRVMMRCKHSKDALVTCLVIFLIFNSHYFWSYGRVRTPKNPVLANRIDDAYVCQLLRDLVISKQDNEIDIRGYIAAGYAWLSEDGLPFIIITVCSIVSCVCYCCRRYWTDPMAVPTSRKICDTLAGDEATASRLHGVEELQSGSIGKSGVRFSKDTMKPDQLPIIRPQQSNINIPIHAKVRYTDSSNNCSLEEDEDNNDAGAENNNVVKQRIYYTQLLFCTVPHLMLAYIICHAPRLVAWPLKTAQTLGKMSESSGHNEQQMFHSESTFILLRVCGELVECAFSIVCLVVFLVRYERFRFEAHWLVLYVAGRH